MKDLTCYMCDQKATSREHAPPRCLFPETKDTSDGTNYRKNLVTVPSCELHNSEKSHDDEYLFFALSGSYTSNSIGLAQFTTKARRAFEKRPSKAANFVLQSAPVQLKRAEHEEWEHGAQIIIDGPRIDRVLGNCARALYAHHTGAKIKGRAEIITNFTMYLDPQIQSNVSSAFDLTANAMATEPLRGENPAIFSYKFAVSETMVIFYFCFYESSSAIVRFRILADSGSAIASFDGE